MKWRGLSATIPSSCREAAVEYQIVTFPDHKHSSRRTHLAEIHFNYPTTNKLHNLKGARQNLAPSVHSPGPVIIISTLVLNALPLSADIESSLHTGHVNDSLERRHSFPNSITGTYFSLHHPPSRSTALAKIITPPPVPYLSLRNPFALSCIFGTLIIYN